MNEHELTGMVQPEQKRYLAQWLRERDVEYMLTATDPNDNPEFIPEGERPCEPHGIYREPIEPGQIRLLARGVGGLKNRLLYVAVMSLWNEDPKEWLIAPFSAYTTPALTGEYLIRPDGDLSLRVLCLWNSRNISNSTIENSWQVDSLSEEEKKQAYAALRHVLLGETLPEQFLSRLGPPIPRPDDPRRIYQNEEIVLWDGVQQRVVETRSEIPILTALPYWKPEPSEMLKAAGDRKVIVTPLIRQDPENKKLVLLEWMETDSMVHVYPTGIKQGPVQWRVREKLSSSTMAGITAYVYLHHTGCPIGMGRFDPTGTIVTWRDVIPESIQEPILNLEELVLVVFGESRG